MCYLSYFYVIFILFSIVRYDDSLNYIVIVNICSIHFLIGGLLWKIAIIPCLHNIDNYY
jgi:hypothetical protein